MIPFNGVNGLRITTHLRIQISYILFVFGVNSGKNQIPYIIEHTQILCFCLFLLLFNCNGIFYYFTFVSSAHNIHLSFTCRVSLFIDSEATFIPPFLTINSFFFLFTYIDVITFTRKPLYTCDGIIGAQTNWKLPRFSYETNENIKWPQLHGDKKTTQHTHTPHRRRVQKPINKRNCKFAIAPITNDIFQFAINK